MKTNYFDGLFDDLPAAVTHVTQPEIDCVTTKIDHVTHKNNDLSKPLRMLRMLRTEIDNTENEQAQRRAFQYRLTDNPEAWLVVIGPCRNLTEAWTSLRARFGDRLLDVAEYAHLPRTSRT